MDSTPLPSSADGDPQATTFGASQEALAKLKIAAKRETGSPELLNKAVRAVRRGDWKTGSELALRLLKQDERNGVAWWIVAICREAASDFRGAIQCYECALQLLPEHTLIANDLGRLAHRLGDLPTAEKLFRHLLAGQPGHADGVNNLACVLRDQHRFDDAI
ncbi:MAG: tetratricopeptide repeat protein, partial [Phenylobacterium sp.]